MKYITLKPKKEMPILSGHPWVFSEAIAEKPMEAALGEIVGLKAADGKFLGLGSWNPNTSISFRLFSQDPAAVVNTQFFASRFLELETWKRPRLPADTDGYRLVHAEVDGLPGLIVDRYADVFVFQLHTAGMELLRNEVIKALEQVFSPKAIVERSDLDVRKIEGLSDRPITVHLGEITAPVKFRETGIIFEADVLKGQKTGFFLDQREARRLVGRIGRGKRVLNLFCYSGAFSLHAAMGGALSVMSIDASRPALESAENQFRLNGLNPDDESKWQFMEADIFELMQEKAPPGGPFDLIICDPPALAKSSKHLTNAMKTYTSLNSVCMKWLSPGGVLVTSSCSGRLDPEEFRSMLRLSAGRAHKDVRLLDWLPQPVDHAGRLAFPEGRYLKTAILEIEKTLLS